jgi:hypothetical protein
MMSLMIHRWVWCLHQSWTQQNHVSRSGSYACGLVVHKLSCPCYFEGHSFPVTGKIASGQIRTKAVRKINTLLVVNVGNGWECGEWDDYY